jgi:hypothetical protein
MSVSSWNLGHRSELLVNIVCIFVYSMHIRISSSNFCSRIPKRIFLVDLLKCPFYNIYMYIYMYIYIHYIYIRMYIA